jgi:2,3-bisphosphoglycerate-independent phosphoglycerate mutase
VKYCILIIDGASGWPLHERNNRTCLQLANTPHLDYMANGGQMGMVKTVPDGMEPSSACACMSILGYDPMVHYTGRSIIEAVSMNVPFNPGDVLFRCNLVSIIDDKMASYSGGGISSEEGHLLVDELNEQLGSEELRFYPGVGYRNICKIKGQNRVLQAACTPPHDRQADKGTPPHR